jgi:hypothetical protein
MKAKLYLVLACLSLSCTVEEEGPASSFYITPYLQNVTPSSITVMWETTEAVKGKVTYGEGDRSDYSAYESKPVKIHEIRLEDLKVGTTYNYRVSRRAWKSNTPSSDDTDFVASFTTAPEPGTENWRLVVYGDNRSNPDTHRGNVEQIMKLKPGIILNSGDLVARAKEYDHWKAQYFDPMRGLAEYVPIFPCLGNHEQNADHYYNYSSVPDENGEVYYSFDYANAHIISLNSNSRDAPFARGEAQTEWLIQDLKANQDKQWLIVFFHHPLFRCHPTRGITSQRWVWQPIFDEYGVDLVVNGHDHYYQRTYSIGTYSGERQKGVFHLISGGGGAGTYPIVPKIHAAARNRIHHVTSLDVMGDRIIGRAIDIDGTIFDSFVIDKKSPSSPEEFIAYEGYLLERDLGEAIRDLPTIPVSRSGVAISEQIAIENPFKAPVRMQVSWLSTNGWTVPPTTSPKVIHPGGMIRIPIKAKTSKSQPYPLPTAQISFTLPDGEKAFRNDTFHFFPIKVRASKVLVVSKATAAPKIDGDLSDRVWSGTRSLSAFVDVQGDRKPERAVQANVVRVGQTLYVSARIEAPAGVLKSGYEGRDNSRAPRNDHFRVHLGAGDTAYTFLVTAKGAELDTRGTNNTEGRKWNSTFTSAVGSWERGWQVEMAVPLGDLGLDQKNLRINLTRRDATANTESELSPTFGRSGLDHRIPMYQGDWKAVDQFVKLRM